MTTMGEASEKMEGGASLAVRINREDVAAIKAAEEEEAAGTIPQAVAGATAGVAGITREGSQDKPPAVRRRLA